MANAFYISHSPLFFSLASKPSKDFSPLPLTIATLSIAPRGNTRLSTATLPCVLTSHSSAAPSSESVIDCVKVSFFSLFLFVCLGCLLLGCNMAWFQDSLRRVKDIRWRDLLNLNSWVVHDYCRLVSSVNAIEPRIRVLSDDQVRRTSYMLSTSKCLGRNGVLLVDFFSFSECFICSWEQRLWNSGYAWAKGKPLLIFKLVCFEYFSPFSHGHIKRALIFANISTSIRGICCGSGGRKKEAWYATF